MDIIPFCEQTLKGNKNSWIWKKSEKKELNINSKTECMVIIKRKRNPSCKIHIGDNEIVEQFKYLRKILTTD